MVTIVRLTIHEAENALNELATLLKQVVDKGAVLGFHKPFSFSQAHAYWVSVVQAIAHRQQLAFFALQDARIVGTIQVIYPHFPHASHRVEIQHLIIDPLYSDYDIATQLLQHVEQQLLQQKKHLVMVDTTLNNMPDSFWEEHSYKYLGRIARYSQNPDGDLVDGHLFYRHLE